MEDERLAKIVLNWQPNIDRHERGQKPTTWLDVVRRDAALYGYDFETLRDLAVTANPKPNKDKKTTKRKGGTKWLKFLEALCEVNPTVLGTDI